MENIEQTRDTSCFSYYNKGRQQVFAISICISLILTIMFETWALCWIERINFSVLPEFSLFITHFMAILCAVYSIFGFFILNQYNQTELSQRIDKFGVKTKLEVVS